MTLKQLAQEAAVSVMTVSNVLNGKGKVSPRKREQIEGLLKKNGYELKNPNSITNKKVHRRIKLYCSEISTLRTDLFTNALLSGILEVTSANFYSVVISPVERGANDRYHISINNEMDVDGFIIVNPRENENFLEEVIKSNIPYVIVGRPAAHRMNVNYVDVDNVAIAYNATTYLLERGHNRILFLTGPGDYTVTIDRVEGYKMALRAYDVDASDDLLLNCEYSINSAKEKVTDFFKKDVAVTAIIANSDMLAIGALDALNCLGYQIPKDISLFCGSETLLTTSYNPPVSGIDTNFVQTGEQAARMLIEIIERRLIKPTHIHVPFVLNERSTVLPLPNNRF